MADEIPTISLDEYGEHLDADELRQTLLAADARLSTARGALLARREAAWEANLPCNGPEQQYDEDGNLIP